MNGQTLDNEKSQFDMFHEVTIRPMLSILYGFFDHYMFKAAAVMMGTTFINLFSTPADWWMALTILVFIDWASGVITAMFEGVFRKELFLLKAYKITGYIMCCGAAAVVANAIPSIFYYAQFGIYIAFFAVELYSVFKHWRVWALFVAVGKTILNGKSYASKFKDLTEAVEHEQQRFDDDKPTIKPRG